jgi:hypothetical protein
MAPPRPPGQSRGRRSDWPAIVRQMAQEERYQLAGGNPNRSLIARETGLSRSRVQAILRK